VAYDSFLPQVNFGHGGVAKRSAFVVGRDGVINTPRATTIPKQLPNFAAILAAVASLK